MRSYYFEHRKPVTLDFVKKVAGKLRKDMEGSSLQIKIFESKRGEFLSRHYVSTYLAEHVKQSILYNDCKHYVGDLEANIAIGADEAIDCLRLTTDALYSDLISRRLYDNSSNPMSNMVYQWQTEVTQYLFKIFSNHPLTSY